MKEQLISFETAKLAKEKGFDEEGDLYFNLNGDLAFDTEFPNLQPTKLVEYYDAPTQSLLQKWLIENYSVYVMVELDCTSYPKFCYRLLKYDNNVWINLLGVRTYSDLFRTYEESLEDGLQIALNLINIK